jgi:hypothetical protein
LIFPKKTRRRQRPGLLLVRLRPPQGAGFSVLQLRHLMQIRGQHLGSFYVVMPSERTDHLSAAGKESALRYVGILPQEGCISSTELPRPSLESCLPLEFGHLVLKCRFSPTASLPQPILT